MTLSQLRTLCLDWLDDPQGTYFTQTVLDLRINLALGELQKRLISANKEYYLECVKTNTVTGQQAYALPDDFLQVIRLEWYIPNTSTTNISNWIAPMTPNQRNLVGVQNGSPQFYTLAKNNVLLWPIPDQVYEVHLEYSYRVAFMTAAGDEPDAPDQFHEYIAVLATRDCLIKDGRPLAPIEQKLGHYEMLLKQIADQRQADAPRMVVSTRYGDDFGGGTW